MASLNRTAGFQFSLGNLQYPLGSQTTVELYGDDKDNNEPITEKTHVGILTRTPNEGGFIYFTTNLGSKDKTDALVRQLLSAPEVALSFKDGQINDRILMLENRHLALEVRFPDRKCGGIFKAFIGDPCLTADNFVLSSWSMADPYNGKERLFLRYTFKDQLPPDSESRDPLKEKINKVFGKFMNSGVTEVFAGISIPNKSGYLNWADFATTQVRYLVRDFYKTGDLELQQPQSSRRCFLKAIMPSFCNAFRGKGDLSFGIGLNSYTIHSPDPGDQEPLAESDDTAYLFRLVGTWVDRPAYSRLAEGCMNSGDLTLVAFGTKLQHQLERILKTGNNPSSEEMSICRNFSQLIEVYRANSATSRRFPVDADVVIGAPLTPSASSGLTPCFPSLSLASSSSLLPSASSSSASLVAAHSSSSDDLVEIVEES